MYVQQMNAKSNPKLHPVPVQAQMWHHVSTYCLIAFRLLAYSSVAKFVNSNRIDIARGDKYVLTINLHHQGVPLLINEVFYR